MKRTLSLMTVALCFVGGIAGCTPKSNLVALTLKFENPRDIKDLVLKGENTEWKYSPAAFDVVITRKVTPGTYTLTWKSPTTSFEFQIKIDDVGEASLYLTETPPYVEASRAEVLSGGANG